jgi:hypothetical protein
MATLSLPTSPAAALSPPGEYPVPAHHRRGHAVVLRDWDGEVWLPTSQPAPEGTGLARYHRHALGFLRHGRWRMLLLFVVTLGAASGLWATDRHAKWVSGVQLPMPVLALIATTVVMVALVGFIGRRVGFDAIAPARRREIVGWGLLSAVVGIGIALAVELGVPHLFGGNPKDDGWSALAGPAEETGKLLVPAILWFAGRYRLPREGYLLVLVSAGAFGILESCEYALNPEHWQPARGLLEIMHPLMTGFAAAVIWQAAYKRRSLFIAVGFGAYAIAMVLHSTNDLLVLDKDAVKATSFISVFVVVVAYLAQKHSARQLVPPDRVDAVSPRWRPVAPRA